MHNRKKEDTDMENKGRYGKYGGQFVPEAIMGALDDAGRVTPLGRRLSALPLEPQLGKTLLLACEEGCAEEALAMSAMLSVEKVFVAIPPRQMGSERAQRVVRRQKRLSSELGDHFTYLNV